MSSLRESLDKKKGIQVLPAGAVIGEKNLIRGLSIRALSLIRESKTTYSLDRLQQI